MLYAKAITGEPLTLPQLKACGLHGLLGDDLDSRSLVGYLGARARRHRDLVFSGLSAWRMVFDGRFKLVRGYDPAKRIGGDVFEPMHVPPDETERLQRERPQLLFDLQRNERDDVAAEFPQVFQRLSAALDEHLAHFGTL